MGRWGASPGQAAVKLRLAVCCDMLQPPAAPRAQLTTSKAAYAKLLQKHNRLMAACDKHGVSWHRELDGKKRKRGAEQAQQVAAAAAAGVAAAAAAAAAVADEPFDLEGVMAELPPDFAL